VSVVLDLWSKSTTLFTHILLKVICYQRSSE